MATGAYAAIHVDTLAMMPYVPPDTALPVVLDLRAHDSTSEVPQAADGQEAKGRSTHLIRRFKRSLLDHWCWPMTHCVTVASEEERVRCERDPPGAACVGGSQRRGLSKNPSQVGSDHVDADPALYGAYGCRAQH